jgi:hypothetical protein
MSAYETSINFEISVLNYAAGWMAGKKWHNKSRLLEKCGLS